MNEVIFLVEEADEGGFIARALSESIITQAETFARFKGDGKRSCKMSFWL